MKASSSSSSSSSSMRRSVVHGVVLCLLLNALYKVSLEAYRIRLYAIKEFGLVIHEFDPYFNYRATEYLYEHGWYKFRTWFDYLVWYPLGRPVGTTIYPGMQVTAVWIKNHILPDMSINDICCYIPAWFGVTATLAVAWLTYECTRESNTLGSNHNNSNHNPTFDTILNNIPGLHQVHRYLIQPTVSYCWTWTNRRLGGAATLGLQPRLQSPLVDPTCAVLAATIMAVVPAHLLRSVAGGYDNESIAMTAMVVTFAAWTTSLRDRVPMYQTVLASLVTGVAYFYMVAAWGGYVFVLNVIGVHATALVLLGRYSTKLHRAYTLFYVVGTLLAIQVPVVGFTPLKSLEQLGPFATFVALQLIEYCETVRRRQGLSAQQTWVLRVKVFAAAGAAGLLAVALLAPTGFFGPISSRVRGLFVKHTKTGNPLVDSVAEHQAASPQAYVQYLRELSYLAPLAWAVTALCFLNDSSSFLIVYGVSAYFFSHRMVRLILLTAPIASALGGIFLGRVAVWMLQGAMELVDTLMSLLDAKKNHATDSNTTNETNAKPTTTSTTGKKTAGGKGKKEKSTPSKDPVVHSKTTTILKILILVARLVASAYTVRKYLPLAYKFHENSHAVAKQISHPTIINKAETSDGKIVIVDDYREAYIWLRDHTPADARIMAWWDYGYQITGIANRTTIADGNTWNHEHIALLGRTLTAPEKEAHRIARHLADYVLVWAGGGGDDVAKSPHLRRIANSVYRGLCEEPTCRDFGFYSDRNPTPDMENSLLYKLHSHNLVPGVEADRNRFREVYNSKYRKVRIYKIQSVSQESKDWVVNNRACDAPGSWFCPGKYPPALRKILDEKKDFKQLEDFNIKGGDDSEYQKEYFKNLNGDGGASVNRGKDAEKNVPKKRKITSAQIEKMNTEWHNTELTTMMYDLISKNSIKELQEIFDKSPHFAHIRSEDGRGPMFWAHELRRQEIIDMMKKLNVSETRTDANGKTPLDK